MSKAASSSVVEPSSDDMVDVHSGTDIVFMTEGQQTLLKELLGYMSGEIFDDESPVTKGAAVLLLCNALGLVTHYETSLDDEAFLTRLDKLNEPGLCNTLKRLHDLMEHTQESEVFGHVQKLSSIPNERLAIAVREATVQYMLLSIPDLRLTVETLHTSLAMSAEISEQIRGFIDTEKEKVATPEWRLAEEREKLQRQMEEDERLALSLMEATWEVLDLSESDLTNQVYEGRMFNGTNFSNSDLSHTKFISCPLDGANFTGVTLQDGEIFTCHAHGINLTHANMENVTIASSDLTGAIVAGTDFRGTKIDDMSLLSLCSGARDRHSWLELKGIVVQSLHPEGRNLSAVNLDYVDLSDADLRQTVMTGHSLHRTEITGALLDRGVLESLLDVFRNPANTIHTIDLRNATFDGEDLSGLDLSHCNLDGVTFDHCIMDRVTLESLLPKAREGKIKLSDVNLSGQDLHGLDFSGVKLRRADLTGVNAVGTNFRGADLRQADLSDARTDLAVFEGARMAGAIRGRHSRQVRERSASESSCGHNGHDFVGH